MTLIPAIDLDDLSQRPQVLLVDDDELTLLLTAQSLRERGFDVFEARSGELALTMLAHWTPDLVVLDALMPGLDGFATCQALRRLAGFENVPVLMLTGLDDFITPSQACIKPVQTPAGTCGRLCGLGAAAKVPIHTPYCPGAKWSLV